MMLFNFSFSQNPEGFEEMLSDQIENVTEPIELEDLKPTYVIIDTRTKEEYDISRIPTALHSEEDLEKFKNLSIPKKDTIVTYCSIGYRSDYFGKEISQLGYVVYNLKGGIFNVANNGGELVDGDNNRANVVHGYDENWSKWLNPDVVEIYLPEKSFQNVLSNTYHQSIGFLNWIKSELLFQSQKWYVNYFLWLIVVSLIVWLLEILFPWRKNQSIFRKDFFQDALYMVLNFYVFAFFTQLLFIFTWESIQFMGWEASSFALLDLSSLSIPVKLLIFFLLSDFVQWFTHYILHHVPLFWEFHKVHHSTKEMGFAAHLRFHWMERVMYQPFKTMVILLLTGLELEQAFLVHYFTIAVGHFNHANLGWDYGILKYVLNNPKMHIWHHAKELPKEHPYGMNFAITLSLWDYMFKTNYIPHDGRDIEIGFENDDAFPKTIVGHAIYPLNKKK